MANTLFTGKDVGVLLPSGESGQRAQESMSNMFLAAEKLRADVFQKNQQDFLKASNIDPVFLLTNSEQETQQKLLDKFNTDWGKKMKEKGGNLSTDDKIQMQRDKNFILMQQQKSQANMQQAMAAKDAIQKDVQGNLDHDDFQKRWDGYLSTGKWDSSPLLPSALPITAKFGNNKITTQNKFEQTDPSNPTRIQEFSSNRADVGERIADEAHRDPRVMRHVFQEWNNLPQQTKDELLKKNEGGNPIMNHYIDKYWGDLVDSKFVNKPGIRTSTANSGNMRTWQGNKYTPTSAMESPFPSLPSNTYHPLPNISKQITIPISKMELLEPDKAVSGIEKPNQSIKGFVTGYDENSDKITFLISQDYKDLDYPTLASGKGMQIAVPRSSFSKEIFDDLEIMKDGKLTKLKDVAKPTPATTPKVDIGL